MKTASVTELKANLSRYLGIVKRGTEVQILDRGVPVARLVGVRGAARSADTQRVERLARAGVLRRGTGNLGWLLESPPVHVKGADLSRALDEDREDRA
jgi:prevent-host-death family protein